MTPRARRATLVAAVTSGLIGGTLLGVGALGTGASASTVCPAGTTLYQSVPPVTAAPVVPADQTDPYASAAVADPDSFLCVVPGYGGAPAPFAPPVTPATVAPAPVAPAPEPVEPVGGGVSLFDSDAPAGVGPDTIPNAPAPGMVPPSQVPRPPVAPPVASPDTPTDESPAGGAVEELPVGVPSIVEELPVVGGEDRGPNDGGERPDGPLDGDNDPAQGTEITRDAVIGRAVSWVLQQVPYSQTSWWTDSNGTYRQDCSGYVSMAWNLDQRTNYWTGNLAKVSHRIPSPSLKPGDVLNLPRSHVVIFAGWANSAKTKFHLYEEYSRGKPARYLTDASLSYYLDRGYGAYRYDKIADVERGRPGAQKTVYELANAAEQWRAPGEDADAMDGVVAVAAQLPPTPWTPGLAEEFSTETAAPVGLPEQITPDPVPTLPLQTLVDAQLATDLRATPALDGTASGSGLALVAAGLGLLFLGVPLGVTARKDARLPRTRPEAAS